MTRLRLLPAAAPAALVLVVAFVLGGLVAPDLHRASHAAEWAAERNAHTAEHPEGHAHGGATDRATTPCPPAVGDIDCALCHGVASSLLTLATSVAAPDLGEAARPDGPINARRDVRFASPSRGPPAARMA